MVRLALLWHMHQPYYEDLVTGEHILPWVRLHAIKDYWGMVAMLREFPRVRVTFNLVPSLLVQIQAFAEDRARDPHLAVGLKPADQLTPSEGEFLVAHGFHAPFDRMIRPYARYAELHLRRHAPASFTVDDLRDLQVWHKLTWMDRDRLQRDERLLALIGKGRGYRETDKAQLREVELELLRAVIPAYRDVAASGQVELSTSPFYHPILPLLCDTDVHFRAHPHSPLPRETFARPADAAAQLDRAIALHGELFGSAPRGVWPSEGSVSDEVITMLAERFEWTATDEEILARSLGRAVDADALYRPYRLGPTGSIRGLFRDHALSDLIGFTYQSWDADAAADDFVERVRAAGRQFGGEVATVSVILDGENAWEHYPGGGRPFLRALYSRLAEASDIETVTMAEAASVESRPLPSIFPGSWINGDFYIWAGHADDHRAWAQVAAARRAFDAHAADIEPTARARAWEELLIAEGSDWFWWYGDDHSSDHDREFDDLFRRHLRNVYAALGRPAPDDLHLTNITTMPASAGPVPLTAFTAAAVDGSSAGFGEWVGTVSVSLGGGGGTMHRVADQLIRSLRVGVNRTTLFLRLEGTDLVKVLEGGFGLAVLVDRPQRFRLDLEPDAVSGPRWRLGAVVEIAVPFAALGVQAADRVSLSVVVLNAARTVIETQPPHPLELTIPSRHVDAAHWLV